MGRESSQKIEELLEEMERAARSLMRTKGNWVRSDDVQEAFARVLSHLFSKNGRVRDYYQYTKSSIINVARNRVRSERTLRCDSVLGEEDRESGSPLFASSAFADPSAKATLQSVFEYILLRLDARQKEIFYFLILGYNQKRIAAFLGVPESTISFHCRRIKLLVLVALGCDLASISKKVGSVSREEVDKARALFERRARGSDSSTKKTVKKVARALARVLGVFCLIVALCAAPIGANDEMERDETEEAGDE